MIARHQETKLAKNRLPTSPTRKSSGTASRKPKPRPGLFNVKSYRIPADFDDVDPHGALLDACNHFGGNYAQCLGLDDVDDGAHWYGRGGEGGCDSDGVPFSDE